MNFTLRWEESKFYVEMGRKQILRSTALHQPSLHQPSLSFTSYQSHNCHQSVPDSVADEMIPPHPARHRLAALAWCILLCTFAYAAPAEKHAFATRFVVTSPAFKSPSSAAEDAYVFAVERAVPKGVRALCLSDPHRSA